MICQPPLERSRGAGASAARSARRRWLPTAAALACLGWAGCSSATPAPPPSPAEARHLLSQFLEAWQEGQTPQTLAQRQPPIQGREPEWTAGAQLIEYAIEEEGAPFGNSFLVRARLTLQHPGARRPETLNVLYAVTAGDPIWIVRE